VADTLLVIGIIAGAIGLGGAFGRGVVGVYRMMRRIEKAAIYVEQEMGFNGGSTIRDAVARIERRLGIDVPPVWEPGKPDRREPTP